MIVLAAGKGRRMRSELPKVLERVGGRALLDHVLTAVRDVDPTRIHVVDGYGGKAVREVV